MKKFIITFFSIVFLLPAFAYAGSYCVKVPTSGNSKWTKRDNHIPIRFFFTYEIVYKDGSVWARIHENRIGANQTGYKHFRVSGGGNDRSHFEYKYIGYGASDYCLDLDKLTANMNDDFDKLTRDGIPASLPGMRRRYYNSDYSVVVKNIKADIRWGGDCPTISGNQVTSGSNHVVKVHRRRGDHINPFGCKWW